MGTFMLVVWLTATTQYKHDSYPTFELCEQARTTIQHKTACMPELSFEGR